MVLLGWNIQGLEPIYEDVIQLLKSTDIGITPTFIVVYNGPSGETYFYQSERLWEDNKLLNFFRKDELIRLRRPNFYWPDDHYAAQMGVTMKKLYDRGIMMQMGAHGNMMGLGAHWEMELFTHGSFSNYDAIEIATINGFRHHGLDHILGSIEPGKLADFVIMRKILLKILGTPDLLNMLLRMVLFTAARTHQGYFRIQNLLRVCTSKDRYLVKLRKPIVLYVEFLL